MRAIALFAGLACLAGAAAQPAAPGRLIDLDRPGALEAIERDDPAHFARLQRILRYAPHVPLPAVQGWIRTEFNAEYVSAPFLLKTSMPPQARLSFGLDGKHYTKVIYVEVRPVLRPADLPREEAR